MASLVFENEKILLWVFMVANAVNQPTIVAE